jgi:hypothetical protein
LGKTKGKKTPEKTRINGRILTRWNIRKWNVGAWTESIWLRIGAGGMHL